MCKTHKSLYCVGWLSLNLFVGKNSLVVLEKIINITAKDPKNNHESFANSQELEKGLEPSTSSLRERKSF